MANSNPSPATRFRNGEIHNPGGKSKERVAQERQNAIDAINIRARMLKAMGDRMNGMTDDQIVEAMDAAALKMLKDAEDRGLGAPVQPVISPNSSFPTMIRLVGPDMSRLQQKIKVG